MYLPKLSGEVKSSSECPSCKQPAKLMCEGCNKVAYCSHDHQKQHWDNHRDDCLAYKILRNDKVGRYAVATRTLHPGEIVFTEAPVVVGPKSETVPVCLGCYTPVDCTVFCSLCDWPVCSPECEAAVAHSNAECQVFRDARVLFQPVEDPSVPCLQYEFITTLRLLLSKRSQPERWENEVQRMESHDEARRNTNVWAVNQVNTVDYIRTVCKLADSFTEEEVHKASGILDVNAFEVRCSHGSVIRGLYPLAGTLSHCCVANTTHTIAPVGELGEQFRLRMRATVRIEKDQELFTKYTYALDSTLLRRAQLKHGKYFECQCYRCADPTELGTHLGSLKCSKCDNGIVLSTNPLDAEAQWKCTHCEFNTRGEAVRRVVVVIQSEIDQLNSLDQMGSLIEMREQIFRKYRSVLHPQHTCMTTLRYSLSGLYGRVDGYYLDDLPDILLERKIDLCKDLLKVADVVDPGYTRLRGLTLYELHAPLLLHAKSRFRYGDIDNRELRDKLEEAAKCLQEAVTILQLEDPNTPEGAVGIVGQESLEQLRASIVFLEADG